MATVTEKPATVETIADLLHNLGDIPPNRVRMNPPMGTATEQDVIDAKAKIGRLCELVDGVLVEKAMGFYESRLATILGHFLETFLDVHDLGFTLAPDGITRMGQNVRLPDVCFFSWDRFSNRLLPQGAILNMAPDLAVEIISPSNTPAEMERKLQEYFLGRSSLVWFIYPDPPHARIYTAPDQFDEIDHTGTLEGGELLPGFSLPLQQLFDRAGRREA